MRRLVILAVAVAFFSVLWTPQTQANTTGDACDALTAKYWCFHTDWTDFGTYVSVDTLHYFGKTGAPVGFTQFERMEFNLYRQDPSTNNWYPLTAFGSLGPFTDNCNNLWCDDHSDYRGYYVSNWADAQTRDKHLQTNGTWWCYWSVDFHLTSPQGTWIETSSNQGFC